MGGAIRAGAKAAALMSLGLALAACTPSRPEPATAFSGFVEDLGRNLSADAPELAAYLSLDPGPGDPQAGAPQIDDRSALSVELRRSAALRGLVRLKALDARAVLPAERSDYLVLKAHFERLEPATSHRFGRFSQTSGFLPYVLDPFHAAFATLPRQFAARGVISSLADAEDYVERLRLVARALDQEAARMQADAAAGIVPPPPLLQRSAQTLADMLAQPPEASPFVAPLRRGLEPIVGVIAPLEAGAPRPSATPVNPALARARDLVAEAEAITRRDILPAYARSARLVASLSARAWSEPGFDRRAYYGDALAFMLGERMDPSEAHRLGRERVKLASDRLDMALRGMGFAEGAVGERLALLDADPRHRFPEGPEGQAELSAALRAHARKAEEQAQAWFGAKPGARVEFILEPGTEGVRARAAAYQPPSLDGARPGLVLLDPESLVSKPRAELATLIHHETYPGHHAQAAAALEADLPLARRLISFPAFSEGWATYAEQLADESGLFEGDALAHVGYLKWRLKRAARLAAESGLHGEGWSEARTRDYLMAAAGISAEKAEHEVARMLAHPGRASAYELGLVRIVAARERARLALGPDFDMRAFHRVVLGHGEVPLSVLDRNVDLWIADRREDARS